MFHLISGMRTGPGSMRWVFVAVKHVFLGVELVKVKLVSSHLELLGMTESLAGVGFCNIA